MRGIGYPRTSDLKKSHDDLCDALGTIIEMCDDVFACGYCSGLRDQIRGVAYSALGIEREKIESLKFEIDRITMGLADLSSVDLIDIPPAKISLMDSAVMVNVKEASSDVDDSAN